MFVKKRSISRQLLVCAVLAASFLAPSYAFGETAVYSSTYTAPECTGGSSVCEVPASLINGRDSIENGNEPNQPNTLAASPCADGTNGTYHEDESLDSYVVNGLSGPELLPGDTVRVDASVWCYSGQPELDIMYVYQADSADSPSWNFMGSRTCPAGGQQDLSVVFKLGNTVGKQAIRVAFTYNSAESPCNSANYNDRDDVVLQVGNTVDTDSDGLYDWYENKYGCLMANTVDSADDTDGDGLTNSMEYSYLTDPCNEDTDGGGEHDGQEISNGHNPLDPSDDYSANAVYDAAFTAPYCAGGMSPCLVPEDLINGRDNMNSGEEPNQPNTIYSSTCADGTSGNYHSDESLDSFVVKDLSNPYFLPGDTVEVDAYVWCWGSVPERDNLYIYHADSVSNPTWNQVGSVQCQEGGLQKLTARFSLGTTIGNQAIRLAFTYNSPAASCDAGEFNDRDDVVLTVMDPVCEDNDGDGYGNGVTCLGLDCDDSDVDNWNSCSTCSDNDADTWYAGCDAYTTRNGPDCDDGNSSVYPGAPELCDGVDNQCPGGPGYGEVDEGCDSDGDGIPDSIEMASCTDWQDPDSDGDGLCDGDRDVYDGSTLICSAGEDMNLNGVVDDGETDPCNPDTDGDGFDDGDEVDRFLTDPLVADGDADNDGLPDSVETGTGTFVDESDTGSDAFQKDSDGDGMDDGDEVFNELTDPNVPDWGAVEVSTVDGNTGCSVYLDGTLSYRGQYIGQAGAPAVPLMVGNLKNELHTITVACPDRFIYRSYVDVDHGHTFSVNADTEYRIWEVQTTSAPLTAGGATIFTGGGYAAPHAADMDRNGTVDVLAGTGDGRVLFYNNLIATGVDLEAGVEVYGGATAIDVGAHAKPLVIDWDNDNCTDLLVGNSAGEVYLFPGTGDCNGELGTGALLISSADTPGGRAAPYAVDWNEDNKKDLMVGGGDGRIKLYLNTGTDAAPVLDSGTILTTAKAETVDAGDYATPLVYDLDRNGLFDLVYGRGDGTLSGCLHLGSAEETAGNLKVEIFEEGLHCDNNPWLEINNDVTEAMDVGDNSAVGLADANGDLQLDMFVGNAAGAIYYYPSSHIYGDIDRSTKVDGADWILLQQSLGLCKGDAGYNGGADLNGDGCVDGADETLLDNNFGYTY